MKKLILLILLMWPLSTLVSAGEEVAKAETPEVILKEEAVSLVASPSSPVIHTEVAMGKEQIQEESRKDAARAKKKPMLASIVSCDPPADGCGSYEDDEYCSIWSGCNVYPDWCQVAPCYGGGSPVCSNLNCYNATNCEYYGHPGCAPHPCYVCE